jgi:predicted adenine nucleotide alpha hydrolase (AANH) superfamily ATPase
MKLLLHTCCGPCSAGCVKALAEEGIAPCLFWYNPNIHPWTEYKARRDCLEAFAKTQGLDLQKIDEYGLRSFVRDAPDRGAGDAAERCAYCCSRRLEKTSACAAANGFNSFSTTLLISPYQDHESIKRTGEKLAGAFGIDFLYRDFRPRFREGQAQARALGFYMQKYCGCIFSEEERYCKKAPA